MNHSLHNAWWRLVRQPQAQSWKDACALGFLRMASLGYGVAISGRNFCYDSGWLKPARLPVPVISLGNLTVGGTGKTSCVEAVVRKLLARGLRPAILSRGYGASRSGYWLKAQSNVLTMDGKPPVNLEGLADEPQLLALSLPGVPVGVAKRRAVSGWEACRQQAAQVIVLDDAFQHRQLHRDCDIVLVHARMPFGGWPLLPRGAMREPLAALRRADVIMITKADEALEMVAALKEHLRRINPEAALVTAAHEPVGLFHPATQAQEPVKALEGRRVALLSSIGDPLGFEATVQRTHAVVLWHKTFPDHHPYSREDIEDAQAQCRRSRADWLVTTMKDWMRIRPLLGETDGRAIFRVLQIAVTILDGEEKLDARLAGVCGR